MSLASLYRDIQVTTECVFTVKRVCDLIRTRSYYFSPLSLFLLNYFIYNRVKVSQIFHGGTISVASGKNLVKAISIHFIRKSSLSLSYLLPTHKKNHSHLTESQYSTWLLKKYSLLQHFSQSEHLQAIVKCLTSCFR